MCSHAMQFWWRARGWKYTQYFQAAPIKTFPCNAPFSVSPGLLHECRGSLEDSQALGHDEWVNARILGYWIFAVFDHEVGFYMRRNLGCVKSTAVLSNNMSSNYRLQGTWSVREKLNLILLRGLQEKWYHLDNGMSDSDLLLILTTVAAITIPPPPTLSQRM